MGSGYVVLEPALVELLQATIMRRALRQRGIGAAYNDYGCVYVDWPSLCRDSGAEWGSTNA